MARGDLVLRVDGFIKDTRARLCWNTTCKFHDRISGNMGCQFKIIDLDESGRCKQTELERRDEDVA